MCDVRTSASVLWCHSSEPATRLHREEVALSLLAVAPYASVVIASRLPPPPMVAEVPLSARQGRYTETVRVYYRHFLCLPQTPNSDTSTSQYAWVDSNHRPPTYQIGTPPTELQAYNRPCGIRTHDLPDHKLSCAPTTPRATSTAGEIRTRKSPR